jgi:hypothetical protein
MKKKKYLHTQFVKFLLESESQAQKELDKLEKDYDESDDDEIIITSKKDKQSQEEIEDNDEVIDDEEVDEMDADKIIERLIQQKNRYKREYENILLGRKRK